ncbi:hypothetical protein MMC07_001429 [Pseudocyphellaria aurata]|nr:hypothetical protein [Pseudocyphellaria aurata]
MEVAGLIVGIAGLAGLFSACKEAVDQVDSYRHFEFESRQIQARFDISKFKFERWVKHVGSTNGELKEVHHTSLDNVAVAQAMRTILSSIQEILENADRTSSTLQLELQDSSSLDPSHPPGFLRKRPTNQGPNFAPVSKKSKISWALGKKTKISGQVETFETWVEKLYSIVQIPMPDPDLKQLIDKLGHSLSEESKERAKIFEAQNRKEVSAWLDAISTDQLFETLLSARLEDTCKWILCRPTYLKWASHDFTSDAAKFLWIYGPAGYGKSVLCARCIQSLMASSASTLAYFFCSSDAEAKREPLAILRSWLLQVVTRNKDAYDIAQEQLRQTNSIPASQSDVWKLFRSIVSDVPNCIFIVDGFDECLISDKQSGKAGSTSRKNFLEELKTSVAHTTTRILLVSRDEIDIRSQMSPEVANPTEETMYKYKILMEDVKSDIGLFSKSVVDKKLSKKDNTLREQLAILMAERCEGMFLWIKLQESDLRGGKNRKQLLQTIENMPSGLEHAYDRDWDNLLRRPRDDRSRALAILRWAVFALRPLTVLEMTEALVVTLDDSNDDLPVDDLPDAIDKEYVDSEILELCGSFLETRESSSEESIGSRTIHLVHFSVKEFLLLARIRNLDLLNIDGIAFSDQVSQNDHLASICVRYLNFEKVRECLSTSEKDQPSCHFLKYAAESWFQHVSLGTRTNHNVTQLTNRLLDPVNPSWNIWRTRLESTQQTSLQSSQKQENDPGTPLYYASLFGLVDTIDWLENERNADPNAIGGQYGNALQAACVKGHMSVVIHLCISDIDINMKGGEYGTAVNAAAACGHQDVLKYLVGRGADIASSDTDEWTPLHWAASQGHLEVVKVLLDKRADIGVTNLMGWTPLNLAADGNHLEVVKLLLDNGADIAVANSQGCAPLYSAADNGHLEVVKLLLDNGADIAVASLRGWTSLNAAADSGHIEVVKLLLNNGADITVPNSFGGTPLYSAALGGHLEVVKLLLNKRADISVVNSEGWTPLNAAAHTGSGHLEVVKLLLNNEAGVEVANSGGWTPLNAAAHSGHLEVVKLLLGNGADVAVANSDGWTPLNSAAGSGHLEVVKLLLNNGADVAVANSDGWTPLNSAADSGHLEVVKLLLNNGADITVANSDGWTPLNAAAESGHLEVVKLLLDNWADITVANSKGWTPLHAAAQGGHLDVVKILLDNGADIAVANSSGWTPLISAANNGHLEVVKLLLDNGADIPVASSNGWTPLHAAASSGHLEVVKLLLDNGADITVASSKGWTPLHAAAHSGHLEVVKLLLGNGADVAVANSDGWTPLNSAAGSGHLEVVKLLLNNGADVAVANSGGWTPLNAAAHSGHLEVVKLLLDNGADIPVASSNGWTPLHAAASSGHLEVVKLLLDNGADITVASSKGWTPLHAAAYKGNLEVVEQLLAKSVDASVYAKSVVENKETVASLSDEVADVTITSRPFSNAEDRLAQLLNRTTSRNQTPLHLAASKHHKDVIIFLLNLQADVNFHDGYGQTSLDYVYDDVDIINSTRNLKISPYFTEPSVRRNYIIDSIKGILDQVQNQAQSFDHYYLGRCLLLLQDKEATCDTLRQTTAQCNDCSQNCEPGNWYACIECTDTDLCNKCMGLYSTTSTIPGCTRHEFVRIQESPLPLMTDTPENADETRRQWLENLRLKYTSISDLG